MRPFRSRHVAAVLTVVAVIAACTGDGTDQAVSPTSTPDSPPTAPPAPSDDDPDDDPDDDDSTEADQDVTNDDRTNVTDDAAAMADDSTDADATADDADASDDSTDDGTDNDSSDDREHDGLGVGSGLVTASLAQLPRALVADGRIEIRLADLELASALDELPIPDRDDHAEVVDWVFRLTGGISTAGDGARAVVPLPYLIGPQWFTALAEVDDELGWTPADIRQFIEYAAPPNSATVMTGDFPLERLSAAMGPPSNGVWLLGPDDFEIDPQERTAARQLGESLRLALDGDRLVVARSLPITRLVLATVQGGPGATLAEDPLIGALAAALDQADAHQATLLSGLDFGAPPAAAQSTDGAGAPLVLPERFDALALGGGMAGDEVVGLLAYAHTDVDAAERNASGLDDLISNGSSLISDRPWAESIERHSIEVIDIDGVSVVLARLHLAEDRSTSLLVRWAEMWDGIVTHR